ncbi:acyltransferase domain-containing protein [Herbaspirillum sp. RTI4]|uniref:ACP S-malonyltransferase n=1 Tax=Herbaspirillum sp. RTI4 TaxID=3048640 RepID=UPI002AB46473|nr:acyltransferase domain-containing protein [Herbaspirillum sp. RTI4]MDY7580097.1 acyltransferase domain-containing protein [Herbaspirillum sp. RTI4]MEA9983122.1 acyltransferase domain-containing protein [Herbaspirillum sp. RTI4]
MSGRLAILCPGQGGQNPGMFDLLPAEAQAAVGVALAPVLAYPLPSILADDSLLFANRIAQPLIVAATLAIWDLLKDALPEPMLVAGYSIGEFSACGVAGAAPASELIALAAQRAALMDACAIDAPQGLMSVTGLAVDIVRERLPLYGIYLAIDTGFDTLIAGGRQADLLAAECDLQARGARIGHLPVSVASHTPLMQGAADPFAARLAQMTFHDPHIPLLAGVSGQVLRHKTAVQEALMRQLTQPIDWTACMDACVEQGITVVLELGPGAALSRMLRVRHPEIACRSVSEFRSLAGIRQWLDRLD